MSLMKLLNKSLIPEKLALAQITASNQEIQILADKFVKILNKKQISTQREVTKIKKAISANLDEECKRNNQLSEALINEIKKAVFKKIDEKISTKIIKDARSLKISKKRDIYSSDEEEEEVYKKQEEESESQSILNQDSSKSKKIKKERKQRKNIKKRKYQTFDQEFKEQVCFYAEKQGVEEAAQKYGLSVRKVMNWVQAYQMNVLGKGRKALDPIMQYNVCIWILRKIWDQIPLTQKIIRQKAATLKTLSKPFNGSKGWLQKFFLRHVQLKSCFDIRNKTQLRAQCARYHKCAFDRLQKDCEDLLRSVQHPQLIVQGDLASIIYFRADHPILKFRADKNLDKQRLDTSPFYSYEEIKDIKIKKFQQSDDISDQCEGQFESPSTNEKLNSVIGTKSEEDVYEDYEEEYNSNSSIEEENISYKQEDSEQNISHTNSRLGSIMKKQQQSSSPAIKYQIYEQSSQESIPGQGSQAVKKQEDDDN